MAAAGWKVVILDLDEPSAKEAADEVAERQQAQTVGLGCDVTDGGLWRPRWPRSTDRCLLSEL
jgi:NAD(P)-dependent dehydrogenase (short-subunit alcohol dehydrogenase family)